VNDTDAFERDCLETRWQGWLKSVALVCDRAGIPPSVAKQLLDGLDDTHRESNAFYIRVAGDIRIKELGERTGYRPMAMSARHRSWGISYPAVDIDFPLIEYTHGEPAALIEHKHEAAGEMRRDHPSCQALGKLATRAGVPFLVARYADDFSWFRVTALNANAEAFIPTKQVKLPEKEYIKFLGVLRKAVVP
jgi:hypothetical protein